MFPVLPPTRKTLCVLGCSQVDRCHRLGRSMLVASGNMTNYICSAKLSKRLPLWSNAKHCAECPPLANLNTQPFDPAAQFGLIDDIAAAYFDFWSEIHEPAPTTVGALRQYLHDVNGPFAVSCSDSRATNAFGHAGRCNFM